MIEIRDSEGNELQYWPVGAVRAGEDSATLLFQVLAGSGKVLACTTAAEGTFMARRQGIGIFVDLAAAPIDLSPYGSDWVMFEGYFHAEEGLSAPLRIALSVGPVGSGSANWVG